MALVKLASFRDDMENGKNQRLVADCVRIQELMTDPKLFLAALEHLEGRLPGGVLSDVEEEVPAKPLTSVLLDAEQYAGLSVDVPIYVGVLSSEAFGEYASKGALFKDVGAGLLHGEYTHRIQWYVVFHAISKGFTLDQAAVAEWPQGPWNHTPAQLLVDINTSGVAIPEECWPAQSKEAYKGLWDALFDRLKMPETYSFDTDGISSPEAFNLRLLDRGWLAENHGTIHSGFTSNAGYGDFSKSFPRLSRIVTRRYVKRRDEKFTGSVVPASYLEKKKTPEPSRSLYKQGIDKTVLVKVLEERVEKEKKKGHKCFLTTACVEARGLPDDCEELTVLRAFRDGYLSRRPGGPEMIEAYYEIAPRILDGLLESAEAPAALAGIYAAVRRAIAQIEQGDHEAALRTYAAMVESLAARYLT